MKQWQHAMQVAANDFQLPSPD